MPPAASPTSSQTLTHRITRTLHIVTLALCALSLLASLACSTEFGVFAHAQGTLTVNLTTNPPTIDLSQLEILVTAGTPPIACEQKIEWRGISLEYRRSKQSPPLLPDPVEVDQENLRLCPNSSKFSATSSPAQHDPPLAADQEIACLLLPFLRFPTSFDQCVDNECLLTTGQSRKVNLVNAASALKLTPPDAEAWKTVCDANDQAAVQLLVFVGYRCDRSASFSIHPGLVNATPSFTLVCQR